MPFLNPEGRCRGTVILVSASPRRSHLLRQVGYRILMHPSGVDESWDGPDEPALQAQALAERKLAAATHHQAAADYDLRDVVALAADTLVAIDGHVLGKPTDRDDAKRMLRLLSGRCHDVWTGICVARGRERIAQVVGSQVCFRPLSDAAIEDYVASGESDDKAGAYGIQHHGAQLIAELKGSFSNVMGLPVVETMRAIDGLRAVS